MGILRKVQEAMEEYEKRKLEIDKLPLQIKKELLEELKKSYINKIEHIIYNK